MSKQTYQQCPAHLSTNTWQLTQYDFPLLATTELHKDGSGASFIYTAYTQVCA